MRSLPPAVGRLVYRAALTVRGETAVHRLLPEARRFAAMPARELEAMQSRRLAELVDLALRESPFYAEHWKGKSLDRGDRPLGERLRALPTVSKRDLQANAGRMITRSHGRANWKTTGGSTATPVRVLKTAEGIAREMAASWAHLELHGVGMGDPSVRFWSIPLRPKAMVRGRLADLAMNRLRFSAFAFDDAAMRAHWERALAFKPRWLYGYATMLDRFAEWIEASGNDGRRLGLALVVPTSEALYDDMRERLVRVFGCPVMNEYGCGEVGPIAYGCAQGMLHVVGGNLVAEVLDERGNPVAAGETGEIVITDLTNDAMPLVRYRMGDMAERGGDCACGRPGPTLARILGRTFDVVHTPNGRRWNGWEVHYLLSTLQFELGTFQQFQVVQDGPDTLDIRLVAEQPLPAATQSHITEYVRTHLDGMRANVHRVEKVERAPSGKLMVVRNDWARREGAPAAS